MKSQRLNDLINLHPHFRGVEGHIFNLAPTIASEDEAVRTFKDSKEAQKLTAEIYENQKRLRQCESYLQTNVITTDAPKAVSLNYDLCKLIIYGSILLLGTLGEFFFLARFLHDLRFEGGLSYLVALVILSANCVILHFALTPDPRAKDAAETAYKRERFVIFLALALLLVSTLCLGIARAMVIAKTLTEDASKQVEIAAAALRFSNFGFTLLPFGFAFTMGILFASVLNRIGLCFIKYKLVQVGNAQKAVETIKAELATQYALFDAGCHIAILAWREGRAAGPAKENTGSSFFENIQHLWKGISPEVMAALFVGAVFCGVVFFILYK